jgi:hypothetical protein
LALKAVRERLIDSRLCRNEVNKRVRHVLLELVSGMPPGLVVIMRTGDQDMSGRVWADTTESHETERNGQSRTIFLGPRVQAILRPWIRTEMGAYLFSPAEAMEQHRAELRRDRRTRLQPSQRARCRKRKPEKSPGERYTRQSYGRAIDDACDRAFPHPELATGLLRPCAGARVRGDVQGHVGRSVNEPG